jgi:hypothetical protein
MFTARIVVLANAPRTCGAGLVSGSDDKPATVEPALLQRAVNASPDSSNFGAGETAKPANLLRLTRPGAVALNLDGIRDSLASRTAPQK